MSHAHFFAYGTLMDAEVLQAVCGLRGEGVAATLHDHRRHALHGAPWPALVPAAGHSVSGVLWRDLPLVAFAALDAFEGDDYRRITVPVALADGKLLKAQAYLWQGPVAALAGDWDLQGFLARHKHGLLAGIKE